MSTADQAAARNETSTGAPEHAGVRALRSGKDTARQDVIEVRPGPGARLTVRATRALGAEQVRFIAGEVERWVRGESDIGLPWWGARLRMVPDGAQPAGRPASGPDATMRALVHAVPVETNVRVIRSMTDTAQLDLVYAAELDNPHHPGGRKGVLDAIEERRGELALGVGADATPSAPGV